MAKLDAKTGKRIFDDDEENQIEMATEARIRAHERLAVREQEKKCRRGQHDEDGSGKCAACGVDVKKPEPDKPKSRHAFLT